MAGRPTKINAALKDHEIIQAALKQEMEWYKSIGDSEAARAKASEQIAERQRMLNELYAEEAKQKKKGLDLTKNQKKALDDLTKEQEEAIKNEKAINTQLKTQENTRKNINAALAEGNRQIKQGWKFLMEQDKIIKNTVLNLGLSGAKAIEMRNTFESSAGLAMRLGGNLEDIQKIMEGYADETGRARVLSSEMVDDIMKIGKGTGLGVEQAMKLGSQFEIMGFDAKSTMDYVQGIVDTSERMGVNTTKVLKNLNDNFKKINTFTFTRGSKAMAEMSMNSEKMKVSMESALNVAESTRSLEKVIDLGAQLQVMGGEFAKMDPLQWLYIARNEPEKITEKLSEMTRGLYTFKKMSDGTFEKFISPADRDRLASVAESLGISKEEIFQIAERKLDMDKMNQDMMSMGLTKREKELIQGAAIFNKDTGKYQVTLAGKLKDISTLTKEQANSFVKETKSLEERAKEAQTFEDAFKATINELKSALMPILRALNGFLVWIRPAVISITKLFTEGPGAWAKVAALFLGVGMLWKGILQPFMQKIGGATIGKLAEKIRGPVTAPTATGGPPGGGISNPNAGKGLMRGGAGVGAAALGIGAGVGLAAVGISKLADSMSKLTKEQGEILQSIVKSLLIFMGIGVGLTVIVAAFGATASAASLGLLAFGAAILMVGAGVAIAALGIGKMTEGFAKMFEASKGAGADMAQIAGGIAGIVGALGMATLTIPNAIAMGMAIRQIAKHADGLVKVGDAFKQIQAVMSGSKEDYMQVASAIESISKLNTRGGSAFSGLANILSKPLKVEFANKDVAVVSNITMNIDGYKFHEATNTGAYVRNDSQESKAGYKGGK